MRSSKLQERSHTDVSVHASRRKRGWCFTALATLGAVACSGEVGNPGGGGAAGSTGAGGVAGAGQAGVSAMGGSNSAGVGGSPRIDAGGPATGGGAGRGGGGGSALDASARDSGAPVIDSGSGGPHTTFYVDGRTLRDPCGQAIVLRGINKMVVFSDRPCASCAEIAKTGANSIRMMWVTSVALSEAETAVNNAVSSGLIPILEMQDATCDALGSSVDAIVNYWTTSASVAFIQKHRAHLIVNIANEAGDSESASAFQSYYTGAVQKMRNAGIHVPLMIDANNCGRNGELLLSVAKALQAADTDHNLLFSMHWYDSGSSQAARVTTVMQTAVDNGIPFLIGEFADVGVPQCSTSPGVPYKQIMAEATSRGIGYLPWEWGPGNSDCKPSSGGNSPFDMTTGSTFATLQAGWATDVAMTDPASIKNTSVRSAFITGGGKCP
jgi:mannan endo-1,4-beta-mannosidase